MLAEMKNVQACEKETVDIESLVTSVSASVSSIRGKINNLLDSTSHITRLASIPSEVCNTCHSLDLINYYNCTEGDVGATGSLAV